MEAIELREDLAYVRRAMERAEIYTNIPPPVYAAVGALGCLGVGLSYAVLGAEVGADPRLAHVGQKWTLAGIWLGTFLGAIAAAALLSRRAARRRGSLAWTSLCSRMFLAQVPIVTVAGVLTVALAVGGAPQWIPALWLLHYAVILHSLSYHTDVIHRVESALFGVLGAAALLWPAIALPCLAVGFGLLQLLVGLYRAKRRAPP